MNGRFLLCYVVLSGIFLTGCTVYDPKLIERSASTGTPPPRPPESTSDDLDTGVRSFAFRDVVINQGSDWRHIGFNLDGWDSQASNDFRGDCTAEDNYADGDNGIDNQFGDRLWTSIQAFLPTLECEVNEAFASGHGTLIMRLEKWNGTPDDARITVSIAPAIDGSSDAITDCDALAGEEVQYMGTDAADPAWDGTDKYCINPYGIVDVTGTARVIDENAYIVDGQVIMSLRSGAIFQLLSGRSSVGIKLDQGVISAQLNGTFDTIEFGFASGRFAIDDLVDVGPSIGVCDQSTLLPIYTQVADVLATQDLGADGTQPCNGISIGVAFGGRQAEWVDVSATEILPKEACDPAIQAAYPWPVQACCLDFTSGADQANCTNYWASMMP